ncbi:MAG: type II secretion system protein [Deltaproteobacteria bacterium]|nr:type II secretion system protein [Deltaproteobacteria bacterium]
MKTSIPKMKNRRGFTLIEVIVTLIVASIMGAILVQFLGTSFLKSADPIIRTDDVGRLQYVMDNMTSNYKYLAATRPNFLSEFRTRVQTPNYYGSGYTVPAAQYVYFDGSNNEVVDGGAGAFRVLKVTIARNNQTLTALFTR